MIYESAAIVSYSDSEWAEVTFGLHNSILSIRQLNKCAMIEQWVYNHLPFIDGLVQIADKWIQSIARTEKNRESIFSIVKSRATARIRV